MRHFLISGLQFSSAEVAGLPRLQLCFDGAADHDLYMAMLKNLEDYQMWFSGGGTNYPFKLSQDAFNNFGLNFLCGHNNGLIALVTDDDKIHADLKSAFQGISIKWMLLGDTKRWGVTNHGTNCSLTGFKLCKVVEMSTGSETSSPKCYAELLNLMFGPPPKPGLYGDNG